MTDLLSSPDRASTDPTAAARALAALLGSIHRDARREARSLPRPEEYAAAARGFWDAMRACADAEAGRDERELAGVRARVREQLNPWFLRSRYWNRAYVKPHGYAGDFRMLEWIYDLERAECCGPDATGGGQCPRSPVRRPAQRALRLAAPRVVRAAGA